MKKLLFFSALCIFSTASIFAQKVSKEDALKVGLNFYKHNAKDMNQTKSSFEVEDFVAIKSVTTGEEAIYAFNFTDNGFVLVSGDMAVTPILAYSYESKFDMSDMAPSTKEWLEAYTRQIENIKAKKSEASEETANLWKMYYANNFDSGKEYHHVVMPMIKSMWGQSFPYNQYCPPVPTNYTGSTYSNGGRCLVGCVATSLAQLLHYYATYEDKNGKMLGMPEYGKGTASYSWGTDYTVDLSETKYDWANMPLRNPGRNDSVAMEGVAMLMFHCGITMNMNYGSEASGSQTIYAVEGNRTLYTHFDYRLGAEYIQRSTVDDVEWKQLLRNELDLSRPVIYSGYDPAQGSHAYVCDGYTTDNYNDFFHFNWGWDGSQNGYFMVDPLETDNREIFYQNQSIIIKAAPKSTEFLFCGDGIVLSKGQGTLEDGSAQNYYFTNTYCEWRFSYSHLNDEEIKFDSLKFTFNKFSLSSNDALSFYDVTDDNNVQLIAKYTGNDIPSILRTKSKEVLVTFSSGNIQSDGWEFSYEIIRRRDDVQLGIETSTLANISIYPNPIKDFFTINGLEGNNSVSIYDISGKQLMIINNLSSNRVDVSSLLDGVYFIKIDNEKDTRTLRVVKQ